jgi:DNA-directed RNA polymerase subunit N (RpoN/RPB10)
MPRDVVFTIQVGRTVSAETWDAFLKRVQAAGRAPRDVIQELIERYAKGETE